MIDERLNSIEYNDLFSLITDIGEDKSDISINEVEKNIESLWKGGLIKTSDFTRLYKQMEDCKKRLSRNHWLTIENKTIEEYYRKRG